MLLPRAAAEDALPGLIGMGVNYAAGWDTHDERRKVGVITAAGLAGRALCVEGHLYAKDFPELRGELDRKAGKLGMSYELAGVEVDDLRADVWKLMRVTFTGAAVLLRTKAAYKRTDFRLCDAAIRMAATAAAAATELRALNDSGD